MKNRKLITSFPVYSSSSELSSELLSSTFFFLLSFAFSTCRFFDVDMFHDVNNKINFSYPPKDLKRHEQRFEAEILLPTLLLWLKFISYMHP